MRLRKADLRRRVNGELRFERDGLTSYAGLELVRRYFASSDLIALLRRELAAPLPRSDFGAIRNEAQSGQILRVQNRSGNVRG